MNARSIFVVIASFSAVIAAIVTGIFTVRNNAAIQRNALTLESFKSDFSQDLEQLKARLGHGQVVSSTQWNAEFIAYQGLWKEMIKLRGMITKYATFEEELIEVGVAIDLARGAAPAMLQANLKSFVVVLTDCTTVINEHAPFYPENIRNSANDVVRLARKFWAKFIAQTINNTADFEWSHARKLEAIEVMQGVDQLETMIRQRLASVRLIS